MNMTKKLISLTLLLGLSLSVLAQDADKKTRFGIQVNPQVNWLRSGVVKKYDKDGSKFGFGFGLITEFKITKNVVFATGIGGSFEGANMAYNGDTARYMLNADQAFIEIDKLNSDTSLLNNPNNHAYWLKSRSYKTTYIILPITLKMMTNEIGAMKYFAMFGGNLGILTKTRVKDDVLDLKTATLSQITIEDLNVSKDCIPVRLGLNVGAGAEYNLSGSTSILFSLNYYRSFTTLSKSESKYLVETGKAGSLKALTHKSFADGIALTVGFLF